MKKIILSGLLILAFASVSYGQEMKLDFRASGFIDEISEYWKNVSTGNSGGIYDVYPAALKPAGPFGRTTPVPGPFNNLGYQFDKKNAYMESRLRLKFDAVMGKELSGTIYFEADAARWGSGDGTRNSFGFWNADRAALEIKNVYIDAAMPYFGIPVPMQVRIGLQGFGIRSPLLIFTDGMGVRPAINIDPVKVSGYWFKAVEGGDFKSDDVDVWGTELTAKISTMTFGGYFIYYNMPTYPFNQASTAPFVDSNYKANAWWLGVYGDGKLGPVDVNFDLIYDQGKVKSRGTYGDYPSVKYKGWMGYLHVDYPWDMFNFGGTVMYASGADKHDTDPLGLPGKETSTGEYSDKVTSFVVPPGSESGAIFGESLIIYSCWVNRGNTGIANTINTNQLSRGGTGGTWMAKVYGSYKVTPWYKATVNVLYVGDTTKHGDTFGTMLNSTRTDYKNNSTIGWEFDLYNEFQIYKNLKFWATGGFMIPGDAFKFYDPSEDRNRKPSNPWSIMTNLTYTF